MVHDCQSQVTKLVTFTAISATKIFFTHHGNQNGHSLEHCIISSSSSLLLSSPLSLSPLLPPPLSQFITSTWLYFFPYKHVIGQKSGAKLSWESWHLPLPGWPDFTCQRPEWWARWIQHPSNVYQTFFIKWSQTRQKKLHVAKNGLRLQNKETMKRYITTSTKLKNPNCNFLLSSTQIFLPPGKPLKTILLSWQTTCMHPCSSENEMSLARQEILLGWLDSTFFKPCSNKQFSSIILQKQ